MSDGAYSSGSIKATIILKTDQFQESMRQVKLEAGNLNKSLNVKNDFADQLATALKKVKSELTSLIDESKMLKSIESNIKTMAGSFDKVIPNIKNAQRQVQLFKETLGTINVSAFNKIATGANKASASLDKMGASAKRATSGVGAVNNTKNTNIASSFSIIQSKLEALGRDGYAVPLKIGKGFTTLNNSLINSEANVQTFISALKSAEVDSASIGSIASQLSKINKELTTTHSHSVALVNTLKGMGNTGVFANLNGQMVELKGSMVSTQEGANKLIMDLRKLKPTEIEMYNAQLRAMKQQFASTGTSVEKLAGDAYRLSSAMKSFGLNVTPFVELNGQLHQIDMSQIRTTEGMARFKEMLASLSPAGLMELAEQFSLIETHITNTAGRLALFKEELATINVPSFNNISTNNTPKINTNATQAILKANQANMDRVISSVNKVTTAYESMGSKGSISIEQVDGKLVKLSSDMVRSSEGAARLRNMFSNLNTSQLVRLQRQLQSLARNTDLLRSKTALCVDTMGNLRMVNSPFAQMKKGMDSVGNASDNVRNKLEGQKRSVNALDTAYGILRRTLSLIIVMFGFQMALEIFQVGKAAMDASYKIKKLGSEMGWTAQQSQKFQNEANRLQKIYPKMDMNETAKSVAEMARVYDLTNDQATKFIGTAAVFNSAMAKEGRSTKDAGLALKDYLDLGAGWTRRMAEIGATKENLAATGYWDGETQDINAQIKALDAYLKKRHYEQMAKNIYTLDEAYDALQYRIGNFIGQGLQALTPYIIAAVQGFLKLLDAVEGIGRALADNPFFQAVALFASVAISVGLLGKALGILKLRVIETFASFATALVANPPLLAIAVTIGIIVTAVYELGKAWGWWDDIPSMLKRIAQELGTVRGQVIALGSALITTAGYFALTKTKAIDILIDKIKEYIGLSKKAKDIEQTPGPTTTGDVGKTPKTPIPDAPDWKKTKTAMWEDFLNNVRSFANLATKIAMGMALMAEAIALLQLPMRALASTGDYFKSDEANIRSGVEGLSLVAPTLIAIAVPISAIVVAMSYFKDAFKISFGAILKSMVVIGVGMLLLSEAIISLIAPMAMFALLGALTAPMKSQVQQGIEAINQLTEALMALVPVIPMFAVAVALGAVAMASEGIGFVAEAAAIGLGILMVSFAIASLAVPLQAVANLGNQNIDINGVKKGAESIKQVSIALQYLSTAMGSIASISISDLATRIANDFSGKGWSGLANSMKDIETHIKDMESVASALSKMKIPKINTDELKKLGQVAEATKNINTAMKSLSEVANQNTGSGTKVTKLGVGIGAVQVDVIEEVKAKIKSINDFMRAFNGIGIVGGTENFSEKIKRIKDMGEAVKQINSAMSSLAGVGNSGGVVGALKGFYYGDQDNGKKFDVLLYNIGKMNEFAKKLSSLDTADVKGDALNRIKNIASHIPSIVQSITKINTSFGGTTFNSATFYSNLEQIRSAVGFLVTFSRGISSLSTEGIQTDVLTRMGWITQDVIKIVDSVKNLQQKLATGDKGSSGGEVNVGKKLGNVFTTLQYIQNFINTVMWNLGSSGASSNGGITTVLNTLSSSIGQITTIASKVTSLSSSLPDVSQNTQTPQKLYNLFTTLQYIKNFLNTVNWNMGANSGGAGGSSGATGVFATFSSALTQINRIAWQVNSLSATLPAADQSNLLGQKLYALFKNLQYIQNFMNATNWNLGKGGGKGNGTGAITGMTSMVNSLKSAIQQLTSVVDGAIRSLGSKGRQLGSAIGNGFKRNISGMGSAMAGQVATINQAISSANHSADNMSVHFNTTKTRVGQLSTAVQTLKDKIDALPNSKTITISVNFQQNGSPDSQSGLSFSLPSAGFGRRLKGFKGLAGLKGFSGLSSLKKFSAPSIGGSFMDAFKSVIGGMKYRHYYGTKNNGDVSDTLNSGESNCVDGALATLQLAKMFGLDGRLGTTLVNGEGHAFAIIEGKIFDATAMQLLGKTKAPNVRYSASNPTSKSSKEKEKPKQEVHIIVDMTDSTFYGDKDFEKKIEKTFEKLSLKLLDVDKNTGV